MNLKIDEAFGVPPRVLYESLLDEKDLTRLALGAPTKMNAKVGGEFSLFGGTIQGEIFELETNRRITMKWKFSDWPEGVSSTVCITLDPEGDDGTRMHLSQTGIPAEDKFGNPGCDERCQKGWEANFWERMEKVLGYARRK